VRAACIAALVALAAPARAGELPFRAGERIGMKITYAHLLAGRARLSVEAAQHEGRPALDFIAGAKSQGFFAWLFRFRVNDRTVARWDPRTRCSLRIEKHLREGRARRDQVVTFDPVAGVALVDDRKVEGTRFEVGACALDVLSAFFVTRLRGVPEGGRLELPVFDNGKRYVLDVRHVGREVLDLPPPIGGNTPTVIVEPRLASGSGLFVSEKGARLKIWLTDDARRVPVRLRAKVAIGSVSVDLESYEPGEQESVVGGSGGAQRSGAPQPQ
jgi:hypothetical protein